MIRSDVRASKFLALVLRHAPDRIGLVLDAHGWADVDELLERLSAHGLTLSVEDLRRIVATNDKRRYDLDETRWRIRAHQGHSIEADLELQAVAPPAALFHGTARRNLGSIRVQGLLPMARQHVHLCADAHTARTVGRRHGQEVVLVVDSAAMVDDGHVFYCAANGVWLTASVPPEYLTELSSDE